MQKVNKNAAKSPQFRTPQRNPGHVCGPIEPSSREGYRYVINFIDEYSKGHFTHMKLFFKITEIETLINITYIVRFLRSTDVSVFYY